MEAYFSRENYFYFGFDFAFNCFELIKIKVYTVSIRIWVCPIECGSIRFKNSKNHHRKYRMIFPNVRKKFLRILQNQRGFSLIEALMAVTLLSVGIIAVVGTTGTIMDKNNDSRKSSIAMTLAQDKIEYFKGIGRTWPLGGLGGLNSPDIVGGVWTANGVGEIVDAGGNAVANAPYTRTWLISNVAGQNFLFNIVMTMAWQDAGGNRTLQLNTEVSQ